MTIQSFNGHTPVIGNHVFIHSTAIIIGDVNIGDDCSIWPTTVIRGDMHRIRIGHRCSIQDGAILHITHDGPYSPGGFPLTVGNDVTVGHGAILHGCQVHNEVLIGMRASVMDGAIIENKVILAAGSLVPPGKRLQTGYLYMGSPAKAVRKLNNKEMDYFQYTASNYIKLKNQYLAATVKY